MSEDYISVAFNINELQALHAALRDKISNLKADHPFVKQYRHMLEGADLKIKLAMNSVFGINEVPHDALMKKKPNLNTAIDVAYRTTIDLARETNSPVEFVCGTFSCGECKECKTCDTVRKAEEWEWRYRDWKESTYGADKNKR